MASKPARLRNDQVRDFGGSEMLFNYGTASNRIRLVDRIVWKDNQRRRLDVIEGCRKLTEVHAEVGMAPLPEHGGRAQEQRVGSEVWALRGE